ncbi:hypothetical protein [uncultured Adlercreutzia sp.]|uniref:hypothetical protein n=2 Tax=uncultured Adlercreutzia sp. TaxID=875803 RepID=UPI0025E80E6E|nr:hypothetical protein [uncultured Adlercreutzia sp.]
MPNAPHRTLAPPEGYEDGTGQGAVGHRKSPDARRGDDEDGSETMSHADGNDRYAFGEEEAPSFDPLASFSFDDEEEEVAGVLAEGPYSPPNPDAVPEFQRNLVSFENGETAGERIEALFDQMPTMQRLLFAILDACDTPVATADLEARIQELKRHHHSVYEPLTLCSLLERAGAIVQTDAEGTLLAATEQEPLRVDVEGVEFWRPAPAPEVYWSLTDEGRAQRDSYRPLELIGACYAAEPQYADIFTTCLELCGREGGESLKALGDVIDDEPVLQSPKRYAMYFIDKLEHAGAVEWRGSWTITDAGREYLASLSDR